MSNRTVQSGELYNELFYLHRAGGVSSYSCYSCYFLQNSSSSYNNGANARKHFALKTPGLSLAF